MGKTITGTVTVGITLTSSADNPVLVASGAVVSGGDAITAGGNTNWTITNRGSLSGTTGDGLFILGGGTVTNAASASITGGPPYGDGVHIAGAAGTVMNAGRIASYGTDVYGHGFWTGGVVLEAGGTVTNSASGLIKGNWYGVAIREATGTVVNYGSIQGGRNGTGVGLGSELPAANGEGFGGSVTNAASAVISGAVLIRGIGTVVNDGTISGNKYHAISVELTSGGLVTNAASATVAGGVFSWLGAVTVVNDGRIAASAWPIGVYSRYGGLVTNAASGVITGVSIGIEGNFVGRETVVNDGSVLGTGTASYGIFLAGGGTVSNGVSASITGVAAGVGAAGSYPDKFAVTVVNDGTITGAGTTSTRGVGVSLKSSAGNTLTNAGTIVGNNGTAVVLGGSGRNLLVIDPGAVFSGVVVGSGGASTLELASAAATGTLNGLGSAFRNFGSIVLDAGAAWAIGGTVAAGETLVEAVGTGTIASGTVQNQGVILAANGGTLTLQSGLVNSNNSAGVLSGGTWEASGGGSTLAVTGGAVAHDAATIILSGAGSVFSAGDGSTFTNLQASLVGVNPIGTLELDAGAAFTAANVIADLGMIRLGAGTLTALGLTLGAGGHVLGFGTITDTLHAILNAGTFAANGGTLAIASAVDAASHGVFQIDAASVLEIAADQGAADTMRFSGAGELIIDAAQTFGLHVGTSAYTGPRLQNFGSDDQILLQDVAPAGMTPVYNAATGLLQISNGSTNVASLVFDTASLGPGVFVIDGDGHGHALLTHSVVPTVYWSAGSGDFNAAGNWTPHTVPVAGIDAHIDAAGTYTVTASTSEAVKALAMVTGATLAVSGGTFTVSNGSGPGGLAGSVRVDAGAVLALSGLVMNPGTIAGPGKLVGGTSLYLENTGTVVASGTAGMTIDLGGGQLQNALGWTGIGFSAGLIEATGAGGLTVANGTVGNVSTMLAANGGTLRFAPGVVSQNNTSGVLRSGTWEASGGGTLAITGGAVALDKATIILSGAGSAFRAGNGSIFTNLQASLQGVAPIGTVELGAGASFTATHGIADFGMIQLAGSTLTLPRLAVGAGGQVRGFGTIADTRYPVFNGGTIEAQGGTLAIATAVGPDSNGVFLLDASSILEIAADQGAADKMRFVGAGGELVIDVAQKFGLNVGSASYTGPLIQNFGTGDEILLKDLAPAGLTPVYNARTGILQVSNGSTNVASLAFEKATLGTGSFHLGDDGHGHVLLTHS